MRARAAAAAAIEREAEVEANAVVVMSAKPRSFQVVRVPAPADLAADRPLKFEVVPLGTVPVLGSRSGTLAPAHPDGRAVTVTVGIPAAALAGRNIIAFVRFLPEGSPAIRVPIALEVASLPRIRVAAVQPMRGARPGDRLDLAFEITNVGNVRDTLEFRLDAPPTWNAHFTVPARAIMAPGETIERFVRLVIPAASDIGDFPITLTAMAGAIERGRAAISVEVADELRSSRRAGPVATLGIASAMSDAGSSRPVETLVVDGPVSENVSLSARYATPMPTDVLTNRALSMLGYSSRANYVSLSSLHWAGTVGTTGLNLSELAGQGIFGKGASAQLRSHAAQLKVVSAAPLGTDGSSNWSPSLFAATTDVRVGAVLLDGFAARLRDSTSVARQLDVFGLGGTVNPWERGMISAHLADRRFHDGSGIGTAAQIRGPIAGADVDLHFTHAPGGSQAFATSLDQLSAAAARQFGVVRTEGSFWTARDRVSSGAMIGSDGWSIGPSITIRHSLTLGADVRRFGFTSNQGANDFGSHQQEFGGKMRWAKGGFDLMADTRWSMVSRDVSSKDAGFVDDTRRITNRADLDYTALFGAFGIGGSVETAQTAGLSVPAPTTLDAHISHMQLIPGVPALTLDAAGQRMQYGPSVLTTVRAELAAEIRRQTRIVAGVERGTARDATGVVRTLFTIRVERTSFLPALSGHGERGLVFQDRNGNGVRDPGEKGIAGIVVRRGAETVVSDGSGVFHLSRQGGGRPEIDSRSLPDGWLQSPRLLDRDMSVDTGNELGVVPTTAVDVRVVLAPLADGSVPNVKLGVATLVLRDSTGREWIAQTDASMRATFDALPAGRYTLVTELDGSSEPLLLDAVPDFELGETPGRQHITVTAHTRPVRIFRPKA